MATYYARLSGNIDASNVWATTPSGTASAVTFAVGDVLVANSFAITINVSTNLGGAGQIRNDSYGGATSGGSFTLSNGVTLTANINATAGLSCCTSSGSISASVIGNITVATGNNGIGITHSSSGTLTITGNVSSKQNTTNTTLSGCFGLVNSGAGAVVITGNVLGGLGSTDYGINNTGSGTVIITGNVSGQNAIGVFNNTATGTVTITGSVNAGNAAAGASNLSTGTFTIIGDITATNGSNAFTSSSTGATNRLSGSFINSANGTAAIYAAKYILNTTPLAAKTRYSRDGISQYVDMFTSDNNPNGGVATTDVRLGVSYGGGLVGVCAVPSASSVASGVPVGSGTGTAVLTAADVATSVWGAVARTITGGTVTTLTNSPNVPSAASIASATRSELAVELAKVSALNTDRLAQCATTSIVGSLIAQSNS